MKQVWHFTFLLILFTLALTVSHAAPAAIRFDGSLGKPGGDLTGNAILANRGVQKGGNLFHSFSRFNVDKGAIATFQTPTNTANILARVTGGSVSKINGTIRTDGPANLYLINPAGVMFGSGASVDVAGSFTATTADYLTFHDKSGIESRFWATTDGATTLVSDPPSKFGFLNSGAEGKIDINLSDGSGEVTNDGLLATGDFSAVGRQISVTDSLVFFEGGDLNFRTSGPGEVGISETSAAKPAPSGNGNITFTNSFFESPGKNFQAHAAGDLQLAQTVLASADGFVPGNSGEIHLTSARDVFLSKTSIQKPNFGEDSAGGITIAAGRDLRITASSAVASSAQASGAGAKISIKSGRDFLVDDFSLVSSSVTGDGLGGSISITAGKDLKITTSSAVDSSAQASGTGAEISIKSGRNFLVDDFGLVSSSATGDGLGGSISIEVAGKLSLSDFGLIQSATTETAGGGSIHVKTRSLGIVGETVWQADTLGRTTGIQSLTEGAGSGGDISVRTTQTISIKDTGGIYASTNAGGRSGSIQVSAGSLRITGAPNYPKEETTIRPDNFFITGISIKSARNELTGSLGSIAVDVKGAITLKNGGLIDASSFSLNPAAEAGDVTVRAASILADRGGSDYFTGIGSGTVADADSGNTGSGSGGAVVVKSSFIKLLNGAQIAASSRSGGDAGNVLVKTRQLFASGSGRETDFLFTGESGIVAATRGLASGGAGGVRVLAMRGADPASLTLSNGAEISARAEGSGGGGSVEVDFSNGSVSLDSRAAISARSGELGGNAGSVIVKGGEISITQSASISSTNDSGPAIGGNAGSVILQPGNLSVIGGRLEVSSAGGDAGSVTIRGGSLLDFRNAEVVAEAYRDGGDLFVRGASYLLLDHSRVSANAERGDGGNIALAADVILNNSSAITASSRFGTDGIVSIDPQAALSGAEDQEDPASLSSTDALQPECTNRLATEAGSFIVAGRGSTPRLPGGYLPSIRLHRTGHQGAADSDPP